MAEDRTGELQCVGVGIGCGAHVVPVEDGFLQAGVPVGLRWGHDGPRKALRGRMAEAVEGSLGYRTSPGHHPTTTACASAELRVMKSSAGGSDGLPEKRLTATSNAPHHAETAVERPRNGALNSVSTCTARVAALK
jgi:hypothetical protein